MSDDAILKEPQDAGMPRLDIDAEVVADISALLDTGNPRLALNVVGDLHPADIARLMSHLPFAQSQELFRALPTGQAGDVLPELDDDYRANLLEESSRIADLIDELDSDDAADVIADLPEELARDVLSQLEDSEEVQELLSYDEDTAGGLMGTEFVSVRTDGSVAEAIAEVRRMAADVEFMYGLYAVDESGCLKGVVPIKQMIIAAGSDLIRDVMETDIVSVPTEMDQEEVARIMERYDLIVLPVVDEAGQILGRITIDDVVDVIREEAEEDISRMSGVAPSEELSSSVFKASRSRLGWLLAGLAGALLAAVVIYSFEETLQQTLALAMFIPVVMAVAGNAGIQSSAIAVQGLASGEIWDSDLLRRLGKELLIALTTGVALAVAFGIVIILVLQFGSLDLAGGSPVRLAVVLAVSILLVVVLATTIGATVPLILGRLGIDPALATGPFITTSNDILGLIVYFWLATAFYLN